VTARPRPDVALVGILRPKAKAGEVTLEELAKAYVTQVHVLTDQNMAETVRRTGLTWRTVSRKLDPARLARWLTSRK
jgi:ActR/RegA family two-component response regulator